MRALLPLIAAAALAGCVAEDGFPSLAPRPGERDLSTEEPFHPRVPIPDDAALRARIAELRARAAAGDNGFDAVLPAARAAVAAAGPRESDSWVAAQQALSRLEAARAPTAAALGALDQLLVERADQPTSDADFALLREALAAAERLSAGQQERFDALRARLNSR